MSARLVANVAQDHNGHCNTAVSSEEQQEKIASICKNLSLRPENRGDPERSLEYSKSLHEAAINGRSKVLESLLHLEGCDVNCRGKVGPGYTPLHLAACNGHVDCVRILLNNNADISAIDEFGKTPIQTAELSSKYTVVKVLKSAGESHLNY